MHIHVLTLFPELFDSFLSTSLIGKACDNTHIEVYCQQLREFADPPHYKVDDTPYGGGGGMVLKPEPLARALDQAKEKLPKAPVLYMTPSGRPLEQARLEQFNQQYGDYIIICGRYEGVDQRIIDAYVDYEISIGDFVLMGGELPAMVFIEALSRLQEGVLGNDHSAVIESHGKHPDDASGRRLLEGPHYTRPLSFQGQEVPAVLRSGDHQKIADWRLEQAIKKTAAMRPELLEDSGDTHD